MLSLYKKIYFSFSPFHLLFQIYKKAPQKLMILLPWLTAGVWMSNKAGFTLFFPNGFLQEQQCICTAEQPNWWASGKAGLRSSETKPGFRDWTELPAAMSLWCTQWRKRSHCREHLSGKPRCHQEYSGDALSSHPLLRHTGCSSEHTYAPHIASATEMIFAAGLLTLLAPLNLA